MDRELLLEIGTEEIPASWLPGLTAQLGHVLEARLKDARISTDEPIETYSTPRRLTVRCARIAERQTDLEEVLNGPPVSAAFDKDGKLTPAGAGFVKKQGATDDQIERVTTPKGEYIAVRKHQRGKASVDVLPDVLTGVLRGMTFPKQMRWDAMLNDGKGELPFGRPIRWILYLYGGRVVPFAIGRSPLAANTRVQDISAGASTYGHRFLTTSGRAGRSVKVKHFDDYRKRLAEHFVILDRSDRHSRIVRELDAEARRRGGRVARSLVGQGMLDEVPDLVEYPVVASGTFSEEFLKLPEEVLTTTMIHHQHFFPVNSDQGKLLPVFLAVLNMEPDNPDVVSRNMERVLAARLRDAQFFYQSDRQQPLAEHQKRLSTVLFHKKIGTYLQKAERVSALAAEIARDVFGAPTCEASAREAGLLCKADLATDMVRELTELQGAMGGVYARDEGRPEEVWKAIYLHYLPVGVEKDSLPKREQLGQAAITWAAVSLADKVDTLVGMFAAGEKPSGSRDPYGLRRAAQGLVRLLFDLRELTGQEISVSIRGLLMRGRRIQGSEWPEGVEEWSIGLLYFISDRMRHLLKERGYAFDEINAVAWQGEGDRPLEVRGRIDELARIRHTDAFIDLANTFKRVKNIAKNLDAVENFRDFNVPRERLVEPAEIELLDQLKARGPRIDKAVASREYRLAFEEAAAFGPYVERFFEDVMVMTDDGVLRNARLRMMKWLELLVSQLADVSQVAVNER